LVQPISQFRIGECTSHMNLHAAESIVQMIHIGNYRPNVVQSYPKRLAVRECRLRGCTENDGAMKGLDELTYRKHSGRQQFDRQRLNFIQNDDAARDSV
jgi:hypothetical protein